MIQHVLPDKEIIDFETWFRTKEPEEIHQFKLHILNERYTLPCGININLDEYDEFISRGPERYVVTVRWPVENTAKNTVIVWKYKGFRKNSEELGDGYFYATFEDILNQKVVLQRAWNCIYENMDIFIKPKKRELSEEEKEVIRKQEELYRELYQIYREIIDKRKNRMNQ